MANVTTTELETELQALATSMGLSVKEYVEGGFLDLSTYGTDKASIEARLDALDVIDSLDGVETLAEKVATLNALFTENGSLATDILNRIATNTTAIGSVQTELTNYKTSNDAIQATQDGNITALQSTQSTISTDLASEATRAQAAEALLAGRLTDTEADLTILNSDATIVGSVAKAVADEAAARIAADASEVLARNTAIATAKTEAINAAGVVSIAGDAALQSQIDNLGTDATASATALAAVQTEIDATQSAIGLNADGSFTPVDGADTLEEYIADVLGDANTLKKAIRKVARKSKQADVALDNKIIQEISDRAAADAALQTQLDTLGGSGSGSLGDVETRLDVIETDLNDTTNPQGALVKGVKSRVSDLEGTVTSNAASTAASLSQLDTDLKAYSDASDLKASDMDIILIGNKFRQALGLADIVGSTGGNGL